MSRISTVAVLAMGFAVTIDDADNASSRDIAGLRAGLAGLAGLVGGQGSLESLLTEVATFAMLAIPGADGAGVTMLEAGEPDTIVASAPFVRDVDSIQYRLGEGPCISAAATGVTNGSGALGEDESWPTFGPQAAELDVHSALSLPLTVGGEVLGALNVYSHAHNAFDGSSRRIGELFARPAAVAVHNARLLDQAGRQTVQLQAALTSRATIDQAIGIFMARSGVTSDEAFLRLRIVSQRDHIKLSMVAQRIVDQAMHQARANRPESNP